MLRSSIRPVRACQWTRRSATDACPGALQLARRGRRRAGPGPRCPAALLTAPQLARARGRRGGARRRALELTSPRQRPAARAAAGARSRSWPAGWPPPACCRRATHERVRNIVASPLTGRRSAASLDVRPLVAALRRRPVRRPGARRPARPVPVHRSTTAAATCSASAATSACSPLDPATVALLLAGTRRPACAPARTTRRPRARAPPRAFLAERAAQGVTRLAAGRADRRPGTGRRPGCGRPGRSRPRRDAGRPTAAGGRPGRARRRRPTGGTALDRRRAARPAHRRAGRRCSPTPRRPRCSSRRGAASSCRTCAGDAVATPRPADRGRAGLRRRLARGRGHRLRRPPGLRQVAGRRAGRRHGRRRDGHAAGRRLPVHWVGLRAALRPPGGDVRVEATGDGYRVRRRAGARATGSRSARRCSE